MKIELTLTSDEYAALSKAPGRSAQQRLRWMIRFWGAVCEERARKKPALFAPTVEVSRDELAKEYPE